MDSGGLGMQLQELAVLGDSASEIAGLLLLHRILNKLLRALGARGGHPAANSECQKRDRDKEDGFPHTRQQGGSEYSAVNCSVLEKRMGWPKPSHLLEAKVEQFRT